MSEFPALKYVGHYQDYSCVTLYQLKNQKKIYSYYFYVFFLPLLYPLSVLMLSYLPPLHLSHALFQFQLFCSNCQAINRLFFDHRAAEKATYSHHKKGEKELKNRATLVCTLHAVQFDIRLYSASRHFPFNVSFTLSQHTLLYLFFSFLLLSFSVSCLYTSHPTSALPLCDLWCKIQGKDRSGQLILPADSVS